MTSLPRASANIENLVPYTSGRSVCTEDCILLNSGECPSALIDLGSLPPICTYPDPLATDLRKALATLYAVSLQNIFVSNGADEIIDLCIQAFCRNDSCVIGLEPTFSMYKFCAQKKGVRYKGIPLNEDFTVVTKALRTQSQKADVLFLTTPNNPTGTVIEPDVITEIIDTFQGLIVIDEAYGEFAEDAGYPSSIPLISQGMENVLVLRTFSKAYAAAGIRVGYGIGSQKIIERLQRVKLPYNVNAVSQTIALMLLAEENAMRENVRMLREEQISLAQKLSDLGCAASNSVTHFFLLQLPTGFDADNFEAFLREKYRILVRNVGEVNGKKSLRINVGTTQQNNLFLSAAKSYFNTS